MRLVPESNPSNIALSIAILFLIGMMTLAYSLSGRRGDRESSKQPSSRRGLTIPSRKSLVECSATEASRP